jgi:hypothetical protein
VKSPKMQGPSQAELDAQAATTEATLKRNAQLDDEEAQRKKKMEEDTAAIANNRVGVRSLLSNDWGGFSRGGDLQGRS